MVVLDEPSEDSICFDDGFLRSIIVSNESSEGSIISSDEKECSLKTGKVVMRPVSDWDRRDQNLVGGREMGRKGTGLGSQEVMVRFPRAKGISYPLEQRETGEAIGSLLWYPRGENREYVSTLDLAYSLPGFLLPILPACFPTAVRNSQHINLVG